MPAHRLPVPLLRPSFVRASLEIPAEQLSYVVSRRGTRTQTDLYLRLDSNPTHKLIPCNRVYELKDRSRPSISSF